MQNLIEENAVNDVVKSRMFVTFFVNNEIFGINVMKVEEIIGFIPITQIPNTADYMKGVINLRGKVVPVIDLRLRFKMSKKMTDASTVILIVDVKDRSVGFIVDAVLDVADLPADMIHDYSRIDSGGSNHFVISIANYNGELVLILNIGRVMDEMDIVLPDELNEN